jgi:UDP-glucose:glycoprotein glucosyltransferase
VVKLDVVRSIYERYAADLSKPVLGFNDVIAQDEPRIPLIEKYGYRLLATKEESPAGHLFINGKHTVLGGVSTPPWLEGEC